MFEVSLDLLQNGYLYILNVPVLISFFRSGSKAEIIRLDSSKKHIVLLVAEAPSMVTIDRDYDIPRKLGDEETPLDNDVTER